MIINHYCKLWHTVIASKSYKVLYAKNEYRQFTGLSISLKITPNKQTKKRNPKPTTSENLPEL